MHSYTIRGEKQEDEVEENGIHKRGRGSLSLKFYSSLSTPKTLRREIEKWDSLWDLEIKISSVRIRFESLAQDGCTQTRKAKNNKFVESKLENWAKMSWTVK